MARHILITLPGYFIPHLAATIKNAQYGTLMVSVISEIVEAQDLVSKESYPGIGHHLGEASCYADTAGSAHLRLHQYKRFYGAYKRLQEWLNDTLGFSDSLKMRSVDLSLLKLDASSNITDPNKSVN